MMTLNHFLFLAYLLFLLIAAVSIIFLLILKITKTMSEQFEALQAKFDAINENVLDVKSDVEYLKGQLEANQGGLTGEQVQVLLGRADETNAKLVTIAAMTEVPEPEVEEPGDETGEPDPGTGGEETDPETGAFV